MPSDVVHMVEDNEEAVRLLEDMLEGDGEPPRPVILVKGSRALKMEEIVNSLSRRS
jgi:UDP-N-acetylmuramyl pentapeptide synthase